MLRKIRISLAVACLTLITLLFLDFTGTCARWFGWLAKIQFLPALMALNAGIIVGLVLFTLVFGRIYCSVICPLGVMQDCFAALGKRAKKNRYRYSPALNTLRYTMLALMVLAIVFGISAFVALLAPYSAYGRIAQTLLSPIWLLGNNLLARWAEAEGSYTFYNVDIWLRGWITLGVASATLIILGILAWRNGRTYCNTVCPVGTVLGFLSRFSLLKPTIDTSKCNACGLCARNCKAACIDSKQHKIDYSRCVACFDCAGAILPIDRAEKSSIQIGHAVWIKSNCVVLTDGVACGNCARHCPTGAITMVPSNPANEESPKIPVVDSERCIGCGACENLCPARPFSAIYVEGHERHRTI